MTKTMNPTAAGACLPPSLPPEVVRFLNTNPLPGVIGGRDTPSSTGATMITRDPGTGTPLAEFSVLSAADVDMAVKAAADSFRKSGWAQMSPTDRGRQLHRLADAVEKHKPIIGHIEALDAGKILAHAMGDVQLFIESIRYFADMALHIQRRHPLAVA